jgi:hypothetical protein
MEIIESLDGKVYVQIDNGNNEFTLILKSVYDAMQAEQSTPIVTSDE